MGKHAYLMIVNDKVEQLCYCIQLLDHPKNDIYIYWWMRSLILQQMMSKQ